MYCNVKELLINAIFIQMFISFRIYKYLIIGIQ